MKRCDALSLSQEMFNVVNNNNLGIQKCIAQCYDGASIMSGVFSGVQKRVSDVVSHAMLIA